MLTAFAMSLCLVATFYVTACRIIPLRRLLGYGMALDLAFTVTALAMFHGSLAGMTYATLSGLIMAGTITTGRAIVGYDRAAGIFWHGVRPHIIWTATPPRWRTARPRISLARFAPLGFAPLWRRPARCNSPLQQPAATRNNTP